MQQATWQTLPNLSAVRVYASICVRKDVIYVVGGCDALGEPVATVEAFNTNANQWTVMKAMPTKRAAPIMDILDDKVLAVGGIGLTQLPVDAVEMFDFDKNDWIVLPPLSEALMGMGHVLKDNKMYIFGGMAADTNPREHLKCVELIKKADNLTTRWQALPNMPTARYACKAFLRDDKAYVIGGRSGRIPVCAFEVYDFQTFSWTKYPDLISKRVFQCYALTDKYLVSLGGLKQEVQKAFSDACEIYCLEDDKNGSWMTNKRMNIPTKRGDFSVACIDNKVIVVGGLGNARFPFSSVEMFNPDNKKWVRLIDCPRQHSTSSSITVKGNLYLFGGISKDGPSAGCEVLKTSGENGVC